MACSYCKKECSWREFCSHECKIKYDKFHEDMKKNARTYLIGALGPVLLMIPGFIFLNYAFIFMAAMVFVMGATFIVLPYSTSDTVKIYGVEGSIRFTRACGIIFMLFGVLLLFMHTVLM